MIISSKDDWRSAQRGDYYKGREHVLALLDTWEAQA
jgi:hypothetical protein